MLSRHRKRRPCLRGSPLLVKKILFTLSMSGGSSSGWATGVALLLSFARLRRLWKQRLDGFGGLSTPLLLELVDPVANGADHLARSLLRALLGRNFFFAGLFHTAALVALDDFYRGFLCHNDLYLQSE